MSRTYTLAAPAGATPKVQTTVDPQATIDLKRLRDDVTHFDAEQCRKSMEHVADFVNEEKARSHLRRSQAQRRARFEMIAWSTLLNRGFSADSVGTIIGMGLGAMLTGGFGPRVGKDGQTKAEKAARAFDKFVDKLIENEDALNGYTPGMGAPERSCFLKNVLIPLRDSRLEKAGIHKPVSIDDAATAVWGVRMHAVQEALKPGANIVQVRRDARRQLMSIYKACASDGIRPEALDGAAARVGTMLDTSDETKFVVQNQEGVSCIVDSQLVAKAFDSIANNPACSTSMVDEMFFGRQAKSTSQRAANQAQTTVESEFSDEPVYEVSDEYEAASNRPVDATGASGVNPVGFLPEKTRNVWRAYTLNEDMEPDVENYHEGMPSTSDVMVDLSTPARITDALGLLGALDSMWFEDDPTAISNEPVDKWGGMFGNTRVFGDLFENGYRSVVDVNADNLNEFGNALATAVTHPEEVPDEYRKIGDVIHDVGQVALRQHGTEVGGSLTERDVRMGVVGHLRELSVITLGVGVTEDPYLGLETCFDEYRSLLDGMDRSSLDPASITRYEDFVRQNVCALMRTGKAPDDASVTGMDADFVDRVRAVGEHIHTVAEHADGGVRYRMLFAAMSTELNDSILDRQRSEGRVESDIGDFASGAYLSAISGEATVDDITKRAFGDVFGDVEAGDAVSPESIKNAVLDSYRAYRANVASPEAHEAFTRTCAAYEVVLSPSIDELSAAGMDDRASNQLRGGRPDFVYGESCGPNKLVSWWFDADAVESYVETGVVPENFAPSTSEHPFEIYRKAAERYEEAYLNTSRDIREFHIDSAPKNDSDPQPEM